jgi:hypothetical protein
MRRIGTCEIPPEPTVLSAGAHLQSASLLTSFASTNLPLR